jgi:hypothetical protein
LASFAGYSRANRLPISTVEGDWQRQDRYNVIETRKNAKKGGDKLSTGLSNWGLAFVCNKTLMGGGGLAEGRRQRDAKRSGDLVIG